MISLLYSIPGYFLSIGRDHVPNNISEGQLIPCFRTIFLWDIRVERAAVRSFVGPKICGDGIDLMGDKCLTASFVSHDALQVHVTSY